MLVVESGTDTVEFTWLQTLSFVSGRREMT